MTEYCTYCGSKNHPVSHCPKTYEGSSRYKNLWCSYCGSRNHNYEACTKHWGSGNMKGAVRKIGR